MPRDPTSAGGGIVAPLIVLLRHCSDRQVPERPRSRIASGELNRGGTQGTPAIDAGSTTMSSNVDKLSRTADEAVGSAAGTARDALGTAREAMDAGYDSARQYANKGLNYAGDVSDTLADFVQRQPWVALAGAFVVGYLAAKALRQISPS